MAKKQQANPRRKRETSGGCRQRKHVEKAVANDNITMPSKSLPDADKLKKMLDDSPPTDMKHANPQEAQKQSIERSIQSIERTIQSLVHACQCRVNENCQLPSCQKMKRVVSHTKLCKRKTNGGCPICKQLMALCCYHAKHCQGPNCPVPLCPNIKHKLKQQQLQQRKHVEKVVANDNISMP